MGVEAIMGIMVEDFKQAEEQRRIRKTEAMGERFFIYSLYCQVLVLRFG